MTSPVLPQINPEAEDDPRISALAKLLTGSAIPPTLAPQRPPSTMLAGQNPNVMAQLAQQARPTSLAELSPANVNLQPNQPKLDLGGVVRGPQNQQANSQTGEPVPHPYDQSTYDQLVAKRNAFAKPIDRNQYKPSLGRTIGAILLGALAGPRGAESVGENVLWGKYDRAKEMQGENLKNSDKELSEFETNQSRIHSSDTEALNNWYRGKEAQYSQGRLENAEQKTRDAEQKLSDAENKPPKGPQTNEQMIIAESNRRFPNDPSKAYEWAENERLKQIREGRAPKDRDLPMSAKDKAKAGAKKDEALRQLALKYGPAPDGKGYVVRGKKMEELTEGDVLSPEEYLQQQQAIQDEYEHTLDEGGEDVRHYDFAKNGFADGGSAQAKGAPKGKGGKSVPQGTNGENAQNATPQTHIFSKSAWAKANPGKDVNAAATFAQNKGYQVAP